MRASWMMAAAVLALGAFPAAAREETWREQSEKTIDVKGLQAVEIVNSRGRIELMPSPDGKLHLTALKIVRGGTKDEAEELARGITVQTTTRGDRFVVEVNYLKRRTIQVDFWDLFKVDGVNVPRYEVRITCLIPPGLAVTARETSGDIRSDGITGPQVLKSTSGDVDVRAPGAEVEASSTSGDVTGSDLRRARVRTVSGDIVLRSATGPLHASSTSGGITVTGAADSLILESVSGDIRADGAPRGLDAGSTSGEVSVSGASGAVRVSTTSGDVRLAVREPLRGLEASTSSGQIRLQVEPSVACAVDMRTSSGDLEVNLPMEMRKISRRGVSGTIRGGRTPVALRTSSGDISIIAAGGQ